MEVNGFNPGPSYALRSPAQTAMADVAIGAGASKRPVENTAQLSQRTPERPQSLAQRSSDEASKDEKKPSQPGATNSSGEPLTKEEESQVRELKRRDAEVKAHEQAHAAVGGAYASAPKYTYTKGPDGKKYAIGGEVQIDTSPERTPDATIRKMDIVIAAALAPAEPSSQDRAVARQAQQQRQEAQNERAEQQAAERAERLGDSSAAEPSGDADGLDSGILAQIMAQAEERSNADEADEGLSSSSSTARAAAASSAYSQAAGLAAQIFIGAGA